MGFDMSRCRNRIDFNSCIVTRPNPIEKIITSGRDVTCAIYCELGLRDNGTVMTQSDSLPAWRLLNHTAHSRPSGGRGKVWMASAKTVLTLEHTKVKL